MKFAQSSFIYFNYPLQEAIRRLGEFGYDGIEIWGGRPHMYRQDLDEHFDEIAGLLARCGLSVPNFIPAQFRYPSILCSDNEMVRRDSVAYVMSAVKNAERIGAGSLSLCAGMVLAGHDLSEGWRCLRQSIVELLEASENAGLNLLIEPAHRFESNLIQTVADGLRMVTEIGHPRLGILLDTGHCQVNGEDLAEAVRSLAGVPFHIHIDDNNGDSDAHMTPGAGRINFAPFAAALAESGYTGFVSAELGFQYTHDPDPAVKSTRAALGRIFQGARS